MFDTTLTVVLLVAGIVLLFTYTDDSGVPYRDGDVLGVLLVVIGTAALLFRRRAAATVAAVATASTFLLWIFDYASPISIIVALVAIYSAGAFASFLSGLAAMAALVVSLNTSIAIAHARYPDAVGLDLPGAVFATLGFIGIWGIGRPCEAAASTRRSSRTGPTGWSGPARRRSGPRWPRNGRGSRVSCTTSWPTTSPS